MTTWIVIVVLALVGGYDLFRVWKKQPTISELYWPLLDWRIDFALMCTEAGLCWWLFGPAICAALMVGMVIGHLQWRGN